MQRSEIDPITDNTELSAPDEFKSVSRVALLGSDYRGVNFEPLCQQGDKILAGTALMQDARRPKIVFTSPVSGEVTKIERGPRRRLVSVQIRCTQTQDSIRFSAPVTPDKTIMREFLLDSGAWAALRTRPFSNIPDPDGEPAAMFITAIDNDAQAPIPAQIIDLFANEFRSAVNALAMISTAPVYVCHALGYAPPVDASSQVRCKAFSRAYTQGLPGAHINALSPIGFAGGEVWHIAYQDVIALGYLLLNGRPWQQRFVTLGGNAVKQPRCLRVAPGASVNELLVDELTDKSPLRILSGSASHGRRTDSRDAFLSAGQRQITVDNEATTGSPGAGNGVMIPTETLDSLAPPGIYAVPLMRALQVGDVDRARLLGALELAEEDLAALSQACQSRCDYGLLLRQVLDQLEGTIS